MFIEPQPPEKTELQSSEMYMQKQEDIRTTTKFICWCTVNRQILPQQQPINQSYRVTGTLMQVICRTTNSYYES